MQTGNDYENARALNGWHNSYIARQQYHRLCDPGVKTYTKANIYRHNIDFLKGICTLYTIY